MKALRTLLAYSTLFITHLVASPLFGQGTYSEDFEDFATRDSFLKYGYSFQAAVVTPSGSIAGNNSVRFGPLSNPIGNYVLTTGFLQFTGTTQTISFRYRASNSSSSPAFRLYLIGMDGVAVDSSVQYSPNGSTRDASVSFAARTGWFKLQWKWTGSGGSSYGYIDNIATTLPSSSVTGGSTMLSDVKAFTMAYVEHFSATDSLVLKYGFVNNGPDVARAGAAFLTLPTGFVPQSLLAGNGSFQNNSNRFSFPALAKGDTAFLTVKTALTSIASFTIQADFSGFAFAVDPVSANNSAQFRFNGAAPLSFQLLNFTAQLKGGESLLQWSVKEEGEVLNYTVERTFDGGAFQPLGTLVAAGGTEARNYSFTDKALGTGGLHTYRLKLTLRNGRIIHSQSIQLKSGTVNKKPLAVVPNPVSAPAAAVINLPAKTTVTLSVWNLAGHRLAQWTGVGEKGDNSLRLPNLAALQKGIYLLRAEAAGETWSTRFVKE